MVSPHCKFTPDSFESSHPNVEPKIQNGPCRSDKGVTLETSAFKLFTVANLCSQLS